MPNKGKLNKLINKLADEKFEYGKNDCYTFTAALVKEWHGVDLTKVHLQYEDEESAHEYIEKCGGYIRLITGTIGYPRKKPEMCEDGDVVLANLPDPTLGFVHDGHGIFKTDKSAKKLKLNKCIMGWSIK